jgi:hypothetical protein
MQKYKAKLKNKKNKETKNYTPIQSSFPTGQANSTNTFLAFEGRGKNIFTF